MRKYIDLASKIAEDTGAEYVGHAEALNWLDAHPDQVPGRTITESEFKGAIDAQYGEVPIDVDEMRSFAGYLGITVVPDPEPTNAEKLAGIIRLISREMSPEGHDKNSEDRLSGELARELDARGVRAPEAGGDDEQ